MRSLFAITLLICLLGLACGGGGGTEAPDHGAAIIDQSGGSVSAPASQTSVAIPPGALSQAVEITVRNINPTSVPATEHLDRDVMGAAEYGPAGTTFSTPVDIKIQLAGAMNAGEKIDLYLMVNGVYEKTGAQGTVDAGGLSASAEVTHFSRYGFLLDDDCTIEIVGTMHKIGDCWTIDGDDDVTYVIYSLPEGMGVEGMRVDVLARPASASSEGCDEVPGTAIHVCEWEEICEAAIYGVVTNLEGDLLNDVRVRLWQQGTLLETVFTNASGEYAFDNLDNGTYGLDFFFEGCQEAEHQVTIIECEDVEYNRALNCGCDAVVYGVVTDQNEDPVNDVLVRIWQSGSLLGSTYTNSSGEYEYGGLDNGTYGIDWIHEDCQDAEQQFTIIECEDLELNRQLNCECTAAVYGTVYDQDEVPLSGVLVKVWHEGSVIGTTNTGEGGAYEYSGLANGSYGLSFHKEGCDVAEASFTIENCIDEEVNKVLNCECNAIAYGCVIDQNEDPVPGVLIKIWKNGELLGTRTTGEGGCWDFGGLTNGTYGIDWIHENCQNKEASFTIENCEDVELNKQLECDCDAMAYGCVIDQNEDPVAGVLIKIWKNGELLGSTTTGEGGCWEYGGLGNGSYGIDWIHENCQDKEASFAIENCQDVELNKQLHCDCETYVFGYVTDQNEDPLDDVQVKLKLGGDLVEVVYTNSEGYWMIDGLSTNTYNLRFYKEGCDVEEGSFSIVECEPVQYDQQMSCECTAVVWGQVYDQNEDPLIEVHVKLWQEGSIIHHTYTGEGGMYEMDGVADGTYTISFHKSGCDTVDDTIVVENCQDVEYNQEMSCECTASVYGMVYDENEDPLTGVKVKVWLEGEILDYVYTGEGGLYEIDGLANGAYGISFHKEGCDTEEGSFSIIECEDKQYNQQMSCECTAAVYGCVTDQNEDPVVGVLVKIWHSGEVVGTTYTGEGGCYEYGGLPDGTYGIDWISDECTDEEDSFTISDCVDVEKNRELECECTAAVYGQVYDQNEDPLPGVKVKVWHDGDLVDYVFTGEGGMYEMGGLPSGNYSISFHKEGCDVEDGNFSIIECEDVQFNQELSCECTAAVYGFVYTGEDTPLPGVLVKIWQNEEIVATGETGEGGLYEIGGLPNGTYGITFHKEGYGVEDGNFHIIECVDKEFNQQLLPN